jgi:hypothetical protein
LNEILESQRSPNDKSGLGYKKEATHAEASTSKKHEVSPSKDEDNVAKARKTSRSHLYNSKKMDTKAKV